ncbi:hypothetical protein VVD49_19165 [Uliginosibacterium sp. H3]|uniref:Uncharacterized protein n=1 Tax=Uliginosibacterium silvisoli TaxID=3114758 RepID=A0ABU6K8D1_9RHOO|nr:hypothetical protein [Uliginosibacterium sp. H3]
MSDDSAMRFPAAALQSAEHVSTNCSRSPYNQVATTPPWRENLQETDMHRNTRQRDTRSPGASTLADSPRLPHEHDETTDKENPEERKPRAVIKQAHDDIVSGKQDTDLHGTPGLDKPKR